MSESIVSPSLQEGQLAANYTASRSTVRERLNSYIYQLYASRDFNECLKRIEEQLKASGGQSEYALYVKALILRNKGRISESLTTFQAALYLNPMSLENLKQVAKSYFLLGQHQMSINLIDETFNIMKKKYHIMKEKYTQKSQKLSKQLENITQDTNLQQQQQQDDSTFDYKEEEDGELYYIKGLNLIYLNKYHEAIECFKTSNIILNNYNNYIQLGRCYRILKQDKEALLMYLDALECSPYVTSSASSSSSSSTTSSSFSSSNSSSSLYTTIGLLYLKLGDNVKAFQYLGNSLTYNPYDIKAILGISSLLQDNDDVDVALMKYRIGIHLNPISSELWNNIAMCLMVKSKDIAAISCLKKAWSCASSFSSIYSSSSSSSSGSLPASSGEWIILTNIGLVTMRMNLFASAFHYLSAAINLNPNYSRGYTYLAMTLVNLDDFENACSAYDKALELIANGNGTVIDELFTLLNYTISLYRNDEIEQARKYFVKFKQLSKNHTNWGREESEMKEQYELLEKALY